MVFICVCRDSPHTHFNYAGSRITIFCRFITLTRILIAAFIYFASAGIYYFTGRRALHFTGHSHYSRITHAGIPGACRAFGARAPAWGVGQGRRAFAGAGIGPVPARRAGAGPGIGRRAAGRAGVITPPGTGRVRQPAAIFCPHSAFSLRILLRRFILGRARGLRPPAWATPGWLGP